jgi:hypothetical protein
MRIRLSHFLLACSTAFLACSHNPQPEAAAPQPTAAPGAGAAAGPAQTSLAGDWSLTLLSQGNATSTDGAIRLRRTAGGGYNGFMQMEGASATSAVRSVRVQGAHFVIVLDTDDGEATIEGNLRGQTRFDALYTSRHTSGRLSGSKQ